MTSDVHTFDNGIKVLKSHLIPEQLARYALNNVHEPEEEEIFMRLLSEINPKGCYINIGSAIGYYPILAKMTHQELTIHAVEPIERHRKFFQENIQLNGMSPNDFIIHSSAISDICGQEDFRDDTYGSKIYRRKRGIGARFKAKLKKTFNFAHRADNKPNELIKVNSITLDEFINKIEKSVDLLQMDVQGHEINVLEGGKNTLATGRIRKLLIGTHGPDIHEKCSIILENSGYRLTFSNFDTELQPDGILLAEVAQ